MPLTQIWIAKWGLDTISSIQVPLWAKNAGVHTPAHVIDDIARKRASELGQSKDGASIEPQAKPQGRER